MYEGKLNETTAKDTLANAVNALTKTFGGKKLNQGKIKKYLKVWKGLQDRDLTYL